MGKLKLVMNSLLGLMIAVIIIGCSAYSGIETDLMRGSNGGRVVAPGGDDSLRTDIPPAEGPVMGAEEADTQDGN